MSEEILQQILSELKEIKAEQRVVGSDIKELKQDVSMLKQDVSMLKQDVSTLKQDVSMLKQDVSTLKQDVSTLKQEQLKTNERLDRLESGQAELKQAAFETLSIVKQLQLNQESYELRSAERFSINESSIEVINRRQLKLEAEVELLKKR